MRKKTIKLFLSVILVAIFGLILVYFYLQKPTVIINGKTITVELVNTQKGRQQGLSGRDKLEKNHGMLFIFNQKDNQIFWNEEMKFPINVVWINNDKIVGISTLPPDSGDNIIVHSPEPVDTVFEVTNETVDQANIKKGDSVKYIYVKKVPK